MQKKSANTLRKMVDTVPVVSQKQKIRNVCVKNFASKKADIATAGFIINKRGKNES